MMMRKSLVLTFLLTVFGLAGCAGMLEENESEARMLTVYSTIKIIDDDPAKAARVREIATEVRNFASNEAHLTVDLLIKAIHEQVNWDKLDAADEYLIQELLLELRKQLVKRLGPGILPEDLRLAVETVAEWVITAANLA